MINIIKNYNSKKFMTNIKKAEKSSKNCKGYNLDDFLKLVRTWK